VSLQMRLGLVLALKALKASVTTVIKIILWPSLKLSSGTRVLQDGSLHVGLVVPL